jgi:hypothetical protein
MVRLAAYTTRTNIRTLQLLYSGNSTRCHKSQAVQGKYARNRDRRNRNVNANIDESLFGAKG